MLHILDTSIKNRATGVVCENIKVQRDIYVYAFSRRFYPKWLTVHSGYTCFVYVFPGNWTHNILRCWRNALTLSHRNTRDDLIITFCTSLCERPVQFCLLHASPHYMKTWTQKHHLFESHFISFENTIIKYTQKLKAFITNHHNKSLTWRHYD